MIIVRRQILSDTLGGRYCMYKKIFFIGACLTMQSTLYPMAQEIANAIISARATKGVLYGAAIIGASSAIGYGLGASAPKNLVGVESTLAGAFTGAYAGAIATCTIAPYAAYKKGGFAGLLAYGASISLIAYAHYSIENQRRKKFKELDSNNDY